MPELMPLETSLAELFQIYEQNRTDLEQKWRKNYDLFRRRDEDVDTQFKKGEGEGWRCRARLGTTRQKVIHAVAIAADTMLQGGKVNFMIEVDPVAKEQLEIAGYREDYFENGLEKMKARIDDNIAKSHGDRQMLKHILSAAIYGTTYGRIAVDDYIRSAYIPIPETVLEGHPELLRWKKVQEISEFPCWKWVSTWDVYTDLEDRDLQENSGTFIRWWTDKSSLSKVYRNTDDPTILPDALKFVAASHGALPGNTVEDTDGSQSLAPKYESLEVTRKNLRVLDFYGKVKLSELVTFLKERGTIKMRQMFADYLLSYEDLKDDDFDPEVEVIASCIGADLTIWRLAPGALEIGRGVVGSPWEESLDDIDDQSITDNCSDTQHLVDGIYRAIIDNQKLSGNVVLGIKEQMLIEPLKEITPGLVIRIDPTCADVRQAVQPLVIPDITAGLLNAFDLTMRMLEDDSAVPRIQQGQEAVRMETAFSLAQRLEKSGKYFGQIIRNFDEGIVEPVVTWMYNYEMAREFDFEGKGAYTVQALGFSSFQNRVTRMNGLIQFLNIALAHPEIYKALKMDSLFAELARMLDLDPEQITYTPAEQQERAAAEAAAAQKDAEMQMAKDNAAIERDKSLATINNTSARVQAEKLRNDEFKTAAELLGPQQQPME